ncbi:branched-chain amino acid ABC transporter permease [Rhodovibrionaceae bacterium A322]
MSKAGSSPLASTAVGGLSLKNLSAEDLFALLSAGAFLLVPTFIESWRLLDLSIYFTYALLALSLSFIWGHVGLLCLGQAIFFGLGAYGMSVVTLGMLPGMEGLVSSWVGLLVAVGLAALVANILARFLFYAQGLQGAFFGVVTLAIAVLAERGFVNWDYMGGLNGLLSVPSFMPGLNGGEEYYNEYGLYYITLAVLALCYLGLSYAKRSAFGLTLAAIRSHELRTRAFGYETNAYKVWAFTLAAAIAGLAGALFVVQFNFASPSLIGFGLSAEALIWVALAGRGSLIAATVGTVLFRILESLLASEFQEYWQLIIGAIFVVVVVFFPQGLIGSLLEKAERLLRRPG